MSERTWPRSSRSVPAVELALDSATRDAKLIRLIAASRLDENVMLVAAIDFVGSDRK